MRASCKIPAITLQGATTSTVEPGWLAIATVYAGINALLVVSVRAAGMSTHAYHIRVCTYSFAYQASCSIVPTALFANWCFSEEVPVNLIQNIIIAFNAPSQTRKGYPKLPLYFLSDNDYPQHKVNRIDKCNSAAIPSSSCHDVDITHMYICMYICSAAIRAEIK